MIKAKHSYWANLIFRRYLNHLIKRNFNSLRLTGELPKYDNNLPILIAPNHSSWWDGFFVYLLNDLFFYKKFYLMMLENQLSKYMYFRKLGAFSIDQNNPKKILESIHYSAEILKSKNNPMLVIYPQGKIEPAWKENIKINQGIEKIIEMADRNVNVIPLGMRIESENQKKPNVYFMFSENVINLNNINNVSNELEGTLNDILNTMKYKILNNDAYKTIR